MGTLIMVGQLLLSLSLLIVLHEGGHFLAARMFKTKVEKFYLFFDFLFPFPNLAKFSIFKFKKGDTEYGIGWFPLGGYVKIAGMLDESADKEALKSPPQPWEFRSKKAWQRLIIILGGIIVNVIVGILIFWMVLFTWGEKYIPTSKAPIMVTDSIGYKIGLKDGDYIVSIDGNVVESYNQVAHDILLNDASKMTVKRDGQLMDIALTSEFKNYAIKHIEETRIIAPRIPFIVGGFMSDSPNKDIGIKPDDRIIRLDTIPITYFDEFKSHIADYKDKEVNVTVLREGQELTFAALVDKEGKLGIASAQDKYLLKHNLVPVEVKKYGFFEAFPRGASMGVKMITDQVKQFKIIFKPETGAYKKVGGFASMSKLYGKKWDWQNFWFMTGMISLVLAFMNFLPIPMLDGGYMMFILWEMITGKPPGEKFMEVANTIGFIIVLALLIFANGNDLFRAFTGK